MPRGQKDAAHALEHLMRHIQRQVSMKAEQAGAFLLGKGGDIGDGGGVHDQLNRGTAVSGSQPGQSGYGLLCPVSSIEGKEGPGMACDGLHWAFVPLGLGRLKQPAAFFPLVYGQIHGVLQFLLIQVNFQQVVHGPAPKGLLNHVKILVVCEHDKHDLRISLGADLQQLQSGEQRHIDVADHDIRAAALHQLQRLPAIADGAAYSAVQPFPAEHGLQTGQDDGLVVGQ